MDVPGLWRGFCDPPDEARPRVWWHWMDGNVDPEGIVADLEWLHAVGVRGVQMFEGGMGTPTVVPERVRRGSPAWSAAVATAVSTADRLGLEFAVATSAGWSAAGGPWVDPADAMTKLVWSETVVEGGAPVAVRLAALPDVAGPYQDCPRWGAPPDAARYARDWLAVAVPDEQVAPVLVPDRVDASGPVGDWSVLVDGSFAGGLVLPRDPDGTSSAWIDQVFRTPVTVSTVTVGLPGPRGFGAAPPPQATLLADDGSGGWRVVAELPEVVVPAAKAVPVRTVACPPVTASRFRLVLTGGSAAAALPRLAPGVRLPPVLRRMSEFVVSEFALAAGGRVHAGELKAGFAAAPDHYALDGDPVPTATGIDPARVLDVSGNLGADGTLRWTAPPGRWRVLRFGASLTGATNGPAPPEATGLEVDKLDAGKVRRYLEQHLATFDAAIGGAGAGRIDALLSDSIESGPQNVTDRFRDRFRQLRGYDLLPWAPALAGYVVGDAPSTDRFLWDHRRTISDLLTSEYYGTVAAVAHERGLTYYAEALEDHRPQLGDDLAMRARADVPMGAMWVFDEDGEPEPTYLADLKGASSVAHVHGRPYTGAESLTAFSRPWSYTPRRLKHVADLELALGVTRFCLHTSPHQPTQAPPPGIPLAPHLGQSFVRSETWAGMAAPWVDYLARCSWLLNQGVPAVDVAVFVGEEAPVTALFGEAPHRPVPPGFDFDYVGLEALEERVTVRDGRLEAGAATYRLLLLAGSSSRMTVRALRRVAELVRTGATVVGVRPTATPSLADDEAEFERLCDRLWGSSPGTGPVHDGTDVGPALAALGASPALVVERGDLLQIGRRIGPTDVVFLANRRAGAGTAVVRVDAPGTPARWDPVTLRRTALAPVPGDASGTRFGLDLPASGSVVLVLGDGAGEGVRPDPQAGTPVRSVLDRPWRLRMPGAGEVDLPDGPRPWTDLGQRASGFSGTATYVTDVLLDAASADRVRALVLTDVCDVARVRINGADLGVLWAAPWRVETRSVLRAGRNIVEIEVANAWMNRLISEAGEPTGELFSPAASVYEPDAPVRPSGLAGPVSLELAGGSATAAHPRN